MRKLIFVLLISNLIFTEYKRKEYNLKERTQFDSNNFSSFLSHWALVMTPYVVNLGICSIVNCKDWRLCCFWVQCPVRINSVPLFITVLIFIVILTNFVYICVYFWWLFLMKGRMLKCLIQNYHVFFCVFSTLSFSYVSSLWLNTFVITYYLSVSLVIFFEL